MTGYITMIKYKIILLYIFKLISLVSAATSNHEIIRINNRKPFSTNVSSRRHHSSRSYYSTVYKYKYQPTSAVRVLAKKISVPVSESLVSTLRVHRGGGGGSSSSTDNLIDDIWGTIEDAMDTRQNIIEDETIILGSGVDYEKLVEGAYGWCCNLGAPSALVAGAVIASIYENMNNPENKYNPKSDTKIIGFCKKLVRLLLITAFASEALCIFVTTVTGTMLLSQNIDTMLLHQGIVRTAYTPLQFLFDHFEYEYLTGHIMFLQGLLNWFLAIALSHAIPIVGASTATTTINQFLAIVLFSTTIFMLATYNKHIYFYSNYGTMLYRWIILAIHRFIIWPPRPLSFVLLPCLVYSIVLGVKVFFLSSSSDDEKDGALSNKKQAIKKIG